MSEKLPSEAHYDNWGRLFPFVRLEEHGFMNEIREHNKTLSLRIRDRLRRDDNFQ